MGEIVAVRPFADHLFGRAKTFWWGGLSIKLVVFVLAACLALSTSSTAWWLPWLALALNGTADTALLASDRYRSDAESLLRKLDLQDSLGWAIEAREVADLSARYPDVSAILPMGETYFASTATGPRRALENLRESSWWSKHLAETMRSASLFAVAAGIVVTLVALVGAVRIAGEPGLASDALVLAKTAVTFLMLAFTLGILRMGLGYHSLHVRCQAIEDRATAGLANDAVACDTASAAKAWSDYHIARAGAPMLPTLVWRLRRRRLNEVWQRTFGGERT